MAKRVSKNQRTDRIQNAQGKDMAKIVAAVKKENGHYSFRQKMVPVDEVQDELKAARS
ncbi:MAG: DUF4295 domain-containing protein [Bacteroidetes bacterium]|jgi:hypothetical protein|nr:DUF4295 domain-containing protein [Bacteroidota bacterium]